MEPVLPAGISNDQLERCDKFAEVANKFVGRKTCNKPGIYYFAQPRVHAQHLEHVELDDTSHPSKKGTYTLLESMELYLSREKLIAADDFATASGLYSGVTVAHKYGCTMCFAYERVAGKGGSLCSKCLQEVSTPPPELEKEPARGVLHITKSSSDEQEMIVHTDNRQTTDISSDEEEKESIKRTQKEAQIHTPEGEAPELKKNDKPSRITQCNTSSSRKSTKN